MNENEIWLPIEGYGGLYQVSNYGRVKSLDYNRTKQEKILRQGKNKYGYLMVVLYKEGKGKTIKIHRLVAQAFIPNPNNYPCVNHKDECKTNNCVDNLEWCTQKYNIKYGTCQQRRVANIDWKEVSRKRVASTDYKAIGRKNAEKLTNGVRSKQVYQYTKDGTLVAIWTSTRECGRNGFNFGAVSQCCNNCFNREGNNVYKGFKWSYTELDKKQEN